MYRTLPGWLPRHPGKLSRSGTRERKAINALLEHINQMGPEIGDLMVDQPETHRWLPMPVSPVLATPATFVTIFAVTIPATVNGRPEIPPRG
jgi:hypothetical protein